MATSRRWPALAALLCTYLGVAATHAQTGSVSDAQRQYEQGAALLNQQNFAQAREHAARAVALYEKDPHADPLLLAASLDLLAACHAWLREPESAEPLVLRALKIRTDKLGEVHPHTIVSLQSAATMYASRGDGPRAIQYLQRAAAAQTQLTGYDSAEVYPFLPPLMALLEQHGPLQDLVNTHQQHVAVMEKARGKVSVEGAHARAAFGLVLKDAALLTDAERELRLALNALGMVQGEGSADVAAVENNLAETLRLQGRFQDARPLHEHVLAAQRALTGQDSGPVARALNNLALLELNAGNHPRAETLFKQSIAMWEKVEGPLAQDLAYPLNNLAELYRQRAQYADARPLYERSLAIRTKAFGPSHPTTITTVQNLALLATEQGDMKTAENLYQSALEALDTSNPLRATVLHNYAGFLRMRGLNHIALDMYQQVLTWQVGTLGREHPRVGDTLNSMALTQLENDKPAMARPLLEVAISIAQKTYGKDHAEVALMRVNLADALQRDGKPREAMALNQANLLILEKQLGSGIPPLPRCTTTWVCRRSRRMTCRPRKPVSPRHWSCAALHWARITGGWRRCWPTSSASAWRAGTSPGHWCWPRR